MSEGFRDPARLIVSVSKSEDVAYRTIESSGYTLTTRDGRHRPRTACP